MSTGGVAVTLMSMMMVCLVGFFIGMAVGFVRGRSAERNKAPAPIQAVCPCTHSIGEHAENGRCQSQFRRQYYNRFGERSGHEWVKCQCTKYWGPQPITDFFHPGTVMVERQERMLDG